MDIIATYKKTYEMNALIGFSPAEAHATAVASIQEMCPTAPTSFFDKYAPAVEIVMVKLSDAPLQSAELLGESFGMFEVKLGNGFVTRVRETQIQR